MPITVVDTCIAASPGTVWSALTAFDDYASWNPFIERIETKGARRRGAVWKVTRTGANGVLAAIGVVLDT